MNFNHAAELTSRAARRAFGQKAFVATVVMLSVAAVGLNGAVAQMKLHFKKLPVPLARPLSALPAKMGNWVQVDETPLDAETQDVLGTDKYIFRDYLNLDADGGMAGAALLQATHRGEADFDIIGVRHTYLRNPEQRAKMIADAMNGRSTPERKEALAIVESQYPDAVVNMAVTYYTGLVDTVAHIPERCYIASGFEPIDNDFPTWTLKNGRQLQVRFINFQDQNGTSQVDRSVAYFFNVNGHYESNALAVRSSLQNLLEKYGYYAKVELMTLDSNHDESAQTMTSFLSESLGEVEKSFPDWKKVNQR